MKLESGIARKLTKLTSLITHVALFAVGSALFGCASNRMIDTGERGLFQRSGGDIVKAPTAETRNSRFEVSKARGQRSDSGFMWPLSDGSISSFFGQRKRDFHDGLDIRANYGSPIFAAKAGQVIYSGKQIKGYGNMIVVKHDDGMASVYAHNRKNLVKRGERVTQGQIVGFVGATGKATGPHLHFEVRRGELPQDPLLYLPQIRGDSVAQQ